MEHISNEEKARRLCCSGCNNYVCYTNQKQCLTLKDLLTMADWKDEQIDTIMLTTEGCLRSFFESQGNTQESIDNFIDALKTQINENLNKTMKTTNQIDREANERKAGFN